MLRCRFASALVFLAELRPWGSRPLNVGVHIPIFEEQPVKIYDGPNLRNVALIGHGDTGKTQLVSALLYTAGMVNRLGKVDEGTSITDYDEEEIQRKFSISATLAYAEWGKTKINFIDTPGFNIFLHETEAALAAADSALLLVHGV